MSTLLPNLDQLSELTWVIQYLRCTRVQLTRRMLLRYACILFSVYKDLLWVFIIVKCPRLFFINLAIEILFDLVLRVGNFLSRRASRQVSTIFRAEGARRAAVTHWGGKFKRILWCFISLHFKDLLGAAWFDFSDGFYTDSFYQRFARTLSLLLSILDFNIFLQRASDPSQVSLALAHVLRGRLLL